MMKNSVNDKVIVKQVKQKGWAGGIFPALYDYTMKKNVIPKKLNASLEMHNMLIRNELSESHGKLLELAAGSGNLASLVNCGIEYSGVDISLGLLKRAARRFNSAGFSNCRLYNCPAEKLPFEDGEFDYCVSNLSLNFFSDIEKAVAEASRVMKAGAVFFGSVPVPERNDKGSFIRGRLLSEAELSGVFGRCGLKFAPIDVTNGAILYFRAVKC